MPPPQGKKVDAGRLVALQSQLVQNVMLERQAWLRRWLDPRRDIDAECGHPLELVIEDYRQLYERGDIAQRIVSIWPAECWSTPPTIFETESPDETKFEKAWKELEQKLALYPTLERADVLSGIGRFGVILLGLDDGQGLDQPVKGVMDDETLPSIGSTPASQLLYLRVFDERMVSISSLVNDTKSPRYGKPDFYQISFQNDIIGGTAKASTAQVHWSRVVHLADNRISSDLYGEPRLKLVVNRILDLHKIAGGSGEMFWRGGFPGISLETSPEVVAGGTANIEFDLEATKTQLEAYMNGLQRYLATVGMNAKSLSVQVADPMPHLEAQVKLISIALGIPWRIFVGSEAAQLASEQDMRAWNRRIARRQSSYVTPFVLLPFLRRLLAAGVLPVPERVQVEWMDLNTPGDKDRAAVAEARTNAILKYMTSGAAEMISPYYFLTLVLGMSDGEVASVLKDSESGRDDNPPLGTGPDDREEADSNSS